VTVIYKFLYKLYLWGSSLWYWAERRFTVMGLGVLAALFFSALLGPDTENNVAYQAFALLLFVVSAAAFFSWFFRMPFTAMRTLPRFGTVGQPLTYTIRVRNLSARDQRGLELLEDLADPRPSFPEWRAALAAEEKYIRSFRFDPPRRVDLFKRAKVKESVVPIIPKGQEAEAKVELLPMRRGLLHFNGLTLGRPDPLGLFRAFSRVKLPQAALILPKRYPLPPLSLSGRLKYQPGGVALASSVGQSNEFVALRDYRPGDPFRHIHWRTWARAGKPVVKEFEDEFFVRHALVLDTFTDHPHSEIFEEAVSVAASFACTLQTQESLLDLLFVGPQSYCFTAGRGLAHSEQMLEVLASVRPCADQGFRTLEHLVLGHVSLVSGCICVFLSWDDERRAFVEKLKACDVPLLVLVVVEPRSKEKIDPGPMSDQPKRFLVLRAGDIEKGLASLEA